MDLDDTDAVFFRNAGDKARQRTRDTLHLLTEISSRDEEGADVRAVCDEARDVILALLGQVDVLRYWAYEGATAKENADSQLSAAMLEKLNAGVFFGWNL